MKFTQFLIFYFLSKNFIQLCTEGCLTCSTNNECLLCDVSNYYYLENDTCVKQLEQPNCINIDINGNCLKCISQNFVDLNTKKCVRVSQENQIWNCQDYDSNQQCLKCNKDFYLNSGKCEIVTNKIEYCDYYSNINTCQKCSLGFLLSLDKKRCVQIQEINNCSIYSLQDCQKCKQGYILNKNLYSQIYGNLKENKNGNQLAQFLMLYYQPQQEITLEMNQVCQEIKVKNCKEYSNFNQCKSCNQGSFLNEQKKCIQNPLPQIQNCILYQNSNQCKKCNNGYYLFSNNCQKIEVIENCEIYDGSHQTTKCLKCNQNYYSTGSSCQLRQNSQNIQNCQQFKPDKDQCDQCNENYIISSDGLKCFDQIQNCLLYNLPITQFQELKCIQCKSGFYPESDFSCQPGSDINCDSFNQQNVCIQCNNEYYIDDQKQCQPQIDISNCQNYSKITLNECLFCKNNFQNFKIKKTCKFQTPINNCLEYNQNSAQLQCAKCEPSYFLSGNECKLISIEFCAEENQGQCIKCQKGYNLNPLPNEKNCVEAFSFLQANCDQRQSNLEINNLEIFQDSCIQCLSYHYPINFAGHNICIKNEELKFFQFSKNLAQNCVKFSNSGDCLQCKIGLYLQEGQCVSQCNSEVHRIIGYNVLGQSNQIQIQLQNFNICIDNFEEENVFAVGLDSSLDNKDELDIIVQCQKDTLPVISFTSEKYTILQPNKITQNFVKSPILKFPQIDYCYSPTSLSPIQQNCQYYIEVNISATTAIRCSKCSQQYTSTINEYSSSNYALENCQINSNCSKDDFSPGLDLIWRKLFSCHSCNTQTKIPVLFIQSQSSSNLKPQRFRKYNLESLKRIDDNNNTNTNIKCLEFKPENIGYNINDSDEMSYYKDLPDNCGLGVVNLSISDGDARYNQTPLENGENRIQLAHYCAACKPGYRPTNLNDIYYYVKIKCELIQNCQGQDWFNSCSQCSNNFVYEITNGNINFAKCVQSNISNCYAALNNGTCQVCIKGYTLNKDNFCEQIKPINCSSSNDFTFIKNYQKNDINIGLFMSGQGQGCIRCNQGFTSVQLTSIQNMYQCLPSNYLQQNYNNLKQDSNYINNCTNYGVKQNQIICSQCTLNHSLDQQQKFCYQTTQYCEIAISNNKCYQCKEGYFLVNENCQKQSIPFCKIPNNNQNYSQPRCVQCEADYYLTQDYKCLLGQVPNCENFEISKPKNCKKCIDGYALYQSSAKSFCYKIDQSLRCLYADIQQDQLYGASLTCTKCKEQSDVLTSDINGLSSSTICMEFQSISFCEIYDKENSLQNSTFLCKQCQNGYYLTKEFNCARRSYQSEFCINYKHDLDQCDLCQEKSHFLNKLGKCQQNPNGIQNCIEYENIQTCQKCKEDYYQINNLCNKIEQNNLIENCKFYQNENQCQQCQNGYLLVDNMCQKIKAQNCKTFQSIDQCQSCDNGYKLQQNEQTIDCILFNKPNCLQYEQSVDNPCLICVKNYFPDQQGNCKLSNILIQNCKQYEQEGICKQCEQGYSLTLNKNACLSLELYYQDYDKNCEYFQTQISCQFCNLGFYLDENNNCTTCKNLGCGICDINNQQICYMCKPEFYMQQNGICVSTVTGITENTFFNITKFFIIIFLYLFNQF